MSIAVELIDDEPGLAGVIPDWRRLAEARGNAFLTPEWFLASLRCGGDGWRPLVAVVRDEGGGLRGLLPFARPPRRRERRLLLGGPIRCDLLHPVAEPADEEVVGTAAAAAVVARCRRPLLVLGNAGPNTAWWRAIAASGRLAAIDGPENVLPCIDLTGLDWDGYLAERSRGLRSQIGRKMRNLHRDHKVKLRLTANQQELDKDLPTLFRLHDARWRERPGASSLSDPLLRDFHADFCSAALARGWLRLLTLEVDETPAASWYGWRLGDRWSYYQAGFDPAWSRHSVGLLILAESIKEAIADGASGYDMLLGDEAFKSRFAGSCRRARRVIVVSRADPARLAAISQAGLARAWRRLPRSSRTRARERIAVLRRRPRR